MRVRLFRRPHPSPRHRRRNTARVVSIWPQPGATANGWCARFCAPLDTPTSSTSGAALSAFTSLLSRRELQEPQSHTLLSPLHAEGRAAQGTLDSRHHTKPHHAPCPDIPPPSLHPLFYRPFNHNHDSTTNTLAHHLHAFSPLAPPRTPPLRPPPAAAARLNCNQDLLVGW